MIKWFKRLFISWEYGKIDGLWDGRYNRYTGEIYIRAFGCNEHFPLVGKNHKYFETKNGKYLIYQGKVNIKDICCEDVEEYLNEITGYLVTVLEENGYLTVIIEGIINLFTDIEDKILIYRIDYQPNIVFMQRKQMGYNRFKLLTIKQCLHKFKEMEANEVGQDK